MTASILVGMMLTTLMLPAQGLLTQSSHKFRAKVASSSATQHYNIKDVVRLLQKMKETCEKEAKDDLDEHDRKQCACERFGAKRKEAIDRETDAITKFDGEVDEATGRSAMLKTQVNGFMKEIADSSATLTQMRLQRQTDNAKFLAQEDDLTETSTLLAQAIQILGKVQFAQQGNLRSHQGTASTALIQVKQLVKHVQKTHRFAKFSGVIQRDLYEFLGTLEEPTKQSDGSKLLQFMPETNELRADEKPNDVEGHAGGVKSYNSRSGAIFGILNTMKEKVDKDLAELQAQEKEAYTQYDKLKAAMLADLKSFNEQLDEKMGQVADLAKAVAIAKDGSDDENENKVVDTAFLADLKKGCKKAAASYEKRAATRAEELAALDETLKILTEDDARSVMQKTIYFLQVGSHSDMSQAKLRTLRKDASEKISKIAEDHHNKRLALLASRLKLDAFTKVRKMMEKMYDELNKQQMEELQMMDSCKANIDAAEDAIKDKTFDKEDLDDAMTKVTNQIGELTKTIKNLKDDVLNLKISLKLAGEDRSEENLVFQTGVGNQRATNEVLQKARKKLQEFYDVQKGASLVQTNAGATAPIESRSEVALIQLDTIIRDAKIEEKEMVEAESEAQIAYNKFVEDTSHSIDTKSDLITEMSEELATAEAKKAEVEEATIANDGELEKQAKLLVAYHTDCDYLIKYFDIRQKARLEEMESITDAKAILAGTDKMSIMQ